jgi:hypothetical protein
MTFEHFVDFQGGVSTATGAKLLAVNPASVAAIYSEWHDKLREHILVLYLNSGNRLAIREEDADSALRDLGLGYLRGHYVLDLERDL